MNERQKTLLRMILSYSFSNVDDLCDAFGRGSDDFGDDADSKVEVDGSIIDAPTENEIEELATHFGVSLR